jgi:hypothetical protein
MRLTIQIVFIVILTIFIVSCDDPESTNIVEYNNGQRLKKVEFTRGGYNSVELSYNSDNIVDTAWIDFQTGFINTLSEMTWHAEGTDTIYTFKRTRLDTDQFPEPSFLYRLKEWDGVSKIVHNYDVDTVRGNIFNSLIFNYNDDRLVEVTNQRANDRFSYVYDYKDPNSVLVEFIDIDSNGDESGYTVNVETTDINNPLKDIDFMGAEYYFSVSLLTTLEKFPKSVSFVGSNNEEEFEFTAKYDYQFNSNGNPTIINETIEGDNPAGGSPEENTITILWEDY